MKEQLNPNKIKTVKLFRELFPADQRIKNVIKENMELFGYDESKPIDLWNDICIDGHTRLQAAKDAGVLVSVFRHDFETEDEALEYAIHNQRDRRNLTDADIIKCVAVLDKRKREGRPKTTSGEVVSGATSPKTAETIGVSRAKVERTRTVLDHADKETKKAVETGQLSINKAYTQTQEVRKQAAKPTFNTTNEKIEWAKWSWNPVTGCKRGCEYCYARDIANRFYPQGFKPTFHEGRLSAPVDTKIPKSRINEEGIKNVFVCSMADLFGEWVPQKWIDDIMDVVKSNPQWKYLFLTKSPERLTKIKFPENAWVGATVDKQSRVKPTEEAFKKVNATVKFVSCEPLIEDIAFNDMSIFNWIIIGGQSKTSAMEEYQPPWKWVENLIVQARKSGCKVYMKPNLKSRPKEYPIK